MSDEITDKEKDDMLQFFLGQLQMHSPKMDGRHSYRFIGNGWPMTHCVGHNRVEAMRAVIAEVKRSSSGIIKVREVVE